MLINRIQLKKFMKIDILTLFPEMFKGPFDESIVKRAVDKKLVEINIHNLRKWTKDKHRTADDRPFGGGVGMVMMIEPIDLALQDLKLKIKNQKSKTHIKNKKVTKINVGAQFTAPAKGKTRRILLSPRGKPYNQKLAQKFSKFDHLILVCGHYEGVDERISDLVDEEISIGDYVLTGGEIPAMVVADSVVRLIPKVLQKPEAIEKESFSYYEQNATRHALLEYPQYTRPADYKGKKVPEVLLSGNHKEIDKWRLKKALELTKKRRPDLLKLK